MRTRIVVLSHIDVAGYKPEKKWTEQARHDCADA